MTGLLTSRQAAAFLGKRQHNFLESYRRWGIPYLPLGRELRFRKKDLLAWQAAQVKPRVTGPGRTRRHHRNKGRKRV